MLVSQFSFSMELLTRPLSFSIRIIDSKDLVRNDCLYYPVSTLHFAELLLSCIIFADV